MNLDEILLLHRSGQFDAAEQAYLQWLDHHPDQVENFHLIWNKLGSLYFSQQKWQKAADAYQQAILYRADYLDAYYNLGLTLNKLRQPEQAIITWRALLDIDSRHEGANFQIGCLLMQREKFSEAIDCFARVPKSASAYVEAQANMATCCLQLGWLNKAKIYYLKVLEVVPDDAQTLYNMGVVQAQLGDLNDAVQYYLRAVAINNQLFTAHNNLGAAYLALKQRELAKQHFEKALVLQPANEAIRHTLAILNKEKNITSSPVPYVTSLFDSYAAHYDAHVSGSLQYQVPEQIYDMITPFLVQSNQQWKVLDLGCGTGLCGKYFRVLADELVGVDLSEQMLSLADSKKIYDKLIKADALTFLQEQQRQFDIIIGGDVFVYMGELAPIFVAAQRALKANGYFIFSVEATLDQGYHLTSTGRFAHNKAYIDHLIEGQHFQLLAFRMISLRMQDGQPVPGYLYLVQASR